MKERGRPQRAPDFPRPRPPGGWLALLPPVGFALHGVLALAAHNRDQLVLGSIGRSLALAVVVPLLLSLAILALGGGSFRAGVVGSLLVIAFFSYGHIYDWARHGPEWLLPVARHRYLALSLAVLVLGGSIWTFRRRTPPTLILRFLSVGAIVLPGLAAFPWLAEAVSDWAKVTPAAVPAEAPPAGVAHGGPDIYYIVLDGFGRRDVLQEQYGFDLAPFLESLDRLGFYTVACSHSNYSHTSLSLASSLNMVYLDELGESMGPASRDLSPLQEKIDHSEVRRRLEAWGYALVAFESGYPVTELTGADAYLAPDYSESREENAWLTGASLNAFEGILLQTTAARVVMDLFLARHESAMAILEFPYLRHRQRVLFTLESLPELAEDPGSRLVFAHVLSPHPPFVFGPDGEPVPNPRPYTLQDSGSWVREEYIRHYRGQAEFLSKLVLVAVEGILQRAPRDSIIILQGDHGPAAHQEIEDPRASDVTERMSILNAIYFPDQDYARLDPALTPVNTFRIVFSQFFGAELDRLPDRSFFSPGNAPYGWWEVTGEFRDQACREQADFGAGLP
ncbi:MAG: hypothetical protein WD906_07765 [Anaerolineales bacterium]